MHNHDGKKNSSAMWTMLTCILFLGVLFFAGGKLFSGGYLGPILIGVFVIAHSGWCSKDTKDAESTVTLIRTINLMRLRQNNPNQRTNINMADAVTKRSIATQ